MEKDVEKVNIFDEYHNENFREDALLLPILKYRDLYNLSPFQRTMYSEYINNFKYIYAKYLEKNRNNMDYVDCLLQIMKESKNLKKKEKENFEHLRICYWECLKLITFNKFKKEQLRKFFILNDELIFDCITLKNLNKEIIYIQLKMFSQMTKCLMFIAFYYNDSVIMNYLNGEISQSQISFMHSNNEESKMIYKNTSHVLLFCKFIYQLLFGKNEHNETAEDKEKEEQKKEENEEKEKPIIELTDLVSNGDGNEDPLEAKIKRLYHKIILLVIEINSFTLSNRECYLYGLQRIQRNDQLPFLNCAFGKLTLEEDDFVKKLNFYAEQIFTKLDTNGQEKSGVVGFLMEYITDKLKSFFSEIGLSDYQPPFRLKICEEEKANPVKKEEEKKEEKKEESKKEEKKEEGEIRPKIKRGSLFRGMIASIKVRERKEEDAVEENPNVNNNYQILIHKTPMINSLIYGIEYATSKLAMQRDIERKSDSNSEKSSSKNKNQTLKLDFVENIFRFVGYALQNNPENCLAFLTKKNFDALAKMDDTYIPFVVNLYYYIVKVLKRHNYRLMNCKYLVKAVVNLMERASKNYALLNSVLKLYKIFYKITKIAELNDERIGFSLRKKVKTIVSQIPLLVRMHKAILKNCQSTLSIEDTLNEEFKNENLDPDILIEIFVQFMKIINLIFDGNAIQNESEFLMTIFTAEQITSILRYNCENIKLRTQFIIFYRISFVDLLLDENKISDYITIFKRSYDNDDIKKKYTNFLFLKDLINLDDNSKGLAEQSNIFLKELNSFEDRTKSVFMKGRIVEKYFQEGIVIPLYVILNKYICSIYDLNGEQYILFYEVVDKYLRSTLKLVEENIQKEKENEKEKEANSMIGLFKFGNKTKFASLTKNFNVEELRADIAKLEREDFPILQYKIIYETFEKHVQPFLPAPDDTDYEYLFTKVSPENEKEQAENLVEYFKETELYQNEFYGLKLHDLLYEYRYQKYSLDESSLYQNLNEKNAVYSSTYRQIVLTLLFYLIRDKKYSKKCEFENLWHVFKLLQYDTDGTQEDIYALLGPKYKVKKKLLRKSSLLSDVGKKPGTEDSEDSENIPKEDIVDFEDFTNYFVGNLISAVFSKCNPTSLDQSDDYKRAYLMIKLFKYTCEDHNKKFQTIFFRKINIVGGGKKIGDLFTPEFSLSMFDLLMCMLTKIVRLADWESIKDADSDDNYKFYYDIFFCMIEFAIEMIQGTTKSNLDEILLKDERELENSLFYIFLKDVKEIVINTFNDSELLNKIKLDLMSFIMAFVEERNTSEKLISLLCSLYKPGLIFSCITSILKTLYNEQNGIENPDPDDVLNKEKCEYFKNLYFSSDEFSECELFVLANTMFKYVKLLSRMGYLEAKIIINSNKKYNEEQILEAKKNSAHKWIFLRNQKGIAEIIDVTFCENYYAVDFFESITRTVFVQGSGKRPEPVLFTLYPNVNYLSEETKQEFLLNVARDTRSSKLFSLMDNVPYFILEINYKKERLEKNCFLKFLNQLNYFVIEVILFILSCVVNIIIAAVVTNDDAEDDYKGPFAMIDEMSIIHAGASFLFLVLWLISKFPLFLSIEIEKFYKKERKNKDESLSCWEYTGIITKTLLMKREFITFTWGLIFSAIGLIKSTNMFLFPGNLFILCNINPNLRNVVRALGNKYKEILLAVAFVIVGVYIFSTVAFFLLSKDFIHDDLVGSNMENACGSLVYCFFTLCEFGLRTDGGIGEFTNKLRFYDNPGYFTGMLLFQFAFFFVIIVIMLAVLSGTIIDTYLELTEKNEAESNDRDNVCFICNGVKNKIEKKGITYEDHINKKHNIYNYINYMIGLRYVDPQETNEINTYVIEKIEQNRISWFPSFDENEMDSPEDIEELN
ncbi:MAG: ion transporter [archaeon]|nr:ion transporter [archaeon]